MSDTKKETAVTTRHEFVGFIEVVDGNPNGDPDADNRPRTDPRNGLGLITNGCIKRKIRDFIALRYGDTPGNKILISRKNVLNTVFDAKFKEVEAKTGDKKSKASAADNLQQIAQVTNNLCEEYFDVRTFGQVITQAKLTSKIVVLFRLLMLVLFILLIRLSLVLHELQLLRSVSLKSRKV